MLETMEAQTVRQTHQKQTETSLEGLPLAKSGRTEHQNK